MRKTSAVIVRPCGGNPDHCGITVLYIGMDEDDPGMDIA